MGRWLLTEVAQNRCCAVPNLSFSCAGPSSALASQAGADSGDVACGAKNPASGWCFWATAGRASWNSGTQVRDANG